MATSSNKPVNEKGTDRTSNKGQKEASGEEIEATAGEGSERAGRSAASGKSRGGGNKKSQSDKKSGENLPSRRK